MLSKRVALSRESSANAGRHDFPNARTAFGAARAKSSMRYLYAMAALHGPARCSTS